MGGGSMYNSQPRYPPNNFGNQYGSYNPYKRWKKSDKHNFINRHQIFQDYVDDIIL